VISAENQQERLLGQRNECDSAYGRLRNLTPEQQRHFLAGFVDGEGSFNVSFARHPTLKSHWIILTKFQIYQHEDHRELLELFGAILGAGRIDKKSGSNVLSLTISNRRDLTEVIIPFFEKYPLATKASAFEKFSVIVEMLNRKEHLDKSGFETILRLAHSMNAHGRFRLHSIQEILDSWGIAEVGAHLAESSETTRQTRNVT
jgi:hypothetical protein